MRSRATDEDTKAFMADYYALTEQYPMDKGYEHFRNRRLWFRPEGMDFALAPIVTTQIRRFTESDEPVIWFDEIETDRGRGLGLASRTLRIIGDLADAHGVSVWLQAAPFGSDKGLARKSLRDWYARYGWKSARARLPAPWEARAAMVRRPQGWRAR